MTGSARSVFVFDIYMLGEGALMMLKPDWLLTPFGCLAVLGPREPSAPSSFESAHSFASRSWVSSAGWSPPASGSLCCSRSRPSKRHPPCGHWSRCAEGTGDPGVRNSLKLLRFHPARRCAPFQPCSTAGPSRPPPFEAHVEPRGDHLRQLIVCSPGTARRSASSLFNRSPLKRDRAQQHGEQHRTSRFVEGAIGLADGA